MAPRPIEWDPVNPAVYREDLPGRDGCPALHLLSHPQYPFTRTLVADPRELFEAELFALATDYLERVGTTDRLIARVVSYLRAGSDQGRAFGWLPISWDVATGLRDPRGSFAVRRAPADGSRAATLILLAGNRSEAGATRAMGMQVGLRVVAQLDPAAGAEIRVRITGLSASGLERAMAPPASPIAPFASLEALTSFAATALRLDDVRLHGLESTGPDTFRIAGSGQQPESAIGIQWSFGVRLVEAARDALVLTGAPSMVRQVSDAMAPAWDTRVFLRDAASAGPAATLIERRVTRRADQLDPFRGIVTLPASPACSTPLSPGGQVLEEDRYQVMRSRVADRWSDPGEGQCVKPQAVLPLRSDALSAVHAAQRAREFFERLDHYGFSSQAVFKFARLPLRLRHRASFDNSPDSRRVNAQVAVEGAPLGLLGPYDPDERPQLAIRFGPASLRHAQSLPNDRDGQRAQPLGLAADPRWAWHEFGHVLCHVSTGDLEYHFAHSCGDALAAVLHDALSAFAETVDAPSRGITFPWAPTRRRHNRQALSGWCWCGRRNGTRRAPVRLPTLLVKGYVEEQMLSSSMFRFYRAVGGDTRGGIAAADEAIRRQAAEVSAYLLIAGNLRLAPADLVPVQTAAAFVCALIDTDSGTDHHPTPVGAAPGTGPRGGSFHKVLRWAFEQQGLYATTDPLEPVEGPGEPPPVDLWIADRRPGADGGYHPVALRWSNTVEPWHADPNALRVLSTGLEIDLGNRGADAATGVQVQAWRAPRAASALTWTPIGSTTVSSVPGKAVVTASITAGAMAGPHWILVQVTCAGDRANLDPAGGLPCGTGTPPANPADLLALVANDNNLALRAVS